MTSGKSWASGHCPVEPFQPLCFVTHNSGHMLPQSLSFLLSQNKNKKGAGGKVVNKGKDGALPCLACFPHVEKHPSQPRRKDTQHWAVSPSQTSGINGSSSHGQPAADLPRRSTPEGTVPWGGTHHPRDVTFPKTANPAWTSSRPDANLQKIQGVKKQVRNQEDSQQTPH